MLKIIVIVVVVIVAGLLIYASTKPDTFSFVRKLKINATPEKVFAEVNDFNRWKSWSPWETKDPAMERTFSGAASGVGAAYEWNGDKNVGQGRMEITESDAPQKIIIKLDFFKPFEAHNIAEFTFTKEGDGTLVTWEMHGPQIFMSKLMCIFMDMEKMVGKDFEAGLTNLKKLAEKNSN
jgi:uncharacterized protein YndB with AHSA1/START domain